PCTAHGAVEPDPDRSPVARTGGELLRGRRAGTAAAVALLLPAGVEHLAGAATAAGRPHQRLRRAAGRPTHRSALRRDRGDRDLERAERLGVVRVELPRRAVSAVRVLRGGEPAPARAAAG